MHSEWQGRLTHWIRTLKDDFYEPLGEIAWAASRTMDHISMEDAQTLPYTPVETGYTWGYTWEYCWFKGEVDLPESAAGERIVMKLEPGGESTLFVNGKSFGTRRADWVNEQHHFFMDNVLTRKAEGGEHFDILMETYAGHYFPECSDGGCATGPVLPGAYQDPLKEGDRRTLGSCTYGIWNEDAYQLYMDAVTLGKLLEILDKDSLRAAHVADALEKFTLAVDFEQDRAGRIADYRKAREILKPALEAVNGSTMPKFYAIGNAHIDLAWLWPMAETHRKTERTFAAQLRHMEEYPEYKFIQSQPAAYEMCRKYYPELFERIKEAVKKGQWIADGAMWVEPDTNMAGGEALVRQVLYGKRYYKEMFDVDSQTLWLPDTFGYSAALPQILKNCGVKYLVTQKIFWTYNEGEQFPYHYFTWRGMDGTEVVSFLPTSYVYNTDPVTINDTWKNRTQKRDLEAFLLPFGYGDGGGGPSRDHIEYVLRQKDLEGGAQVKIAGPQEFFEDMEALGGPENTYVGELYFSAHRGTYTSQAMVKKNNRKCELALRALELYSTLAAEKGLPYPKEKIEELWKEVLLHQFHDILPGSSIARVYEDAEKAFERILKECSELTEEALKALAKGEEGITVFNPLDFASKAVVTLPEAYAKGARTADGKEVAVTVDGDEVRALVEMPAFGIVTLVPGASDEKKETAVLAKAERTEGGFCLENSEVRALVDEKGEITSFILKSSGREFAAGSMNHLKMYKDVPRLFDAWDIDSNYINQETDGAYDVSVEIEKAKGVEAVLHVTGKIGVSTYEQKIRLAAKSRRVEITMTVDWKELHRLMKTTFPVDVYAEEGINEIQFGWIKRPTHRSRAYEKDRFEVCNHRYSALCDGSHGAAVLNDSKYGISMNGNCLELSLLTASAAPEMRADNRVHTFTYAFTAWEGDFVSCDVVRQGLELNVKPLLAEGTAVDGISLTGYETSCDNIVLDTVKLAEDGSGDRIYRFYESKKAAVNAKIRLPQCKKAVLCDMLENPVSEVEVEDGVVELPFHTFEIKTVRVS